MDIESVDELMAEDLWGEHPKHPRQGWIEDVIGGDTQLGYWDWVKHSIESEASESEGDEEDE